MLANLKHRLVLWLTSWLGEDSQEAEPPRLKSQAEKTVTYWESIGGIAGNEAFMNELAELELRYETGIKNEIFEHADFGKAREQVLALHGIKRVRLMIERASEQVQKIKSGRKNE